MEKYQLNWENRFAEFYIVVCLLRAHLKEFSADNITGEPEAKEGPFRRTQGEVCQLLSAVWAPSGKIPSEICPNSAQKVASPRPKDDSRSRVIEYFLLIRL
ncbi:hypothetical protein B9Z55_026770 [Caenorhabditis nigoni]|nr:hypothetical protein B9Z55_026770 [Caenorhabditis nigoni]